jgi:hypothetical protein
MRVIIGRPHVMFPGSLKPVRIRAGTPIANCRRHEDDGNTATGVGRGTSIAAVVAGPAVRSRSCYLPPNLRPNMRYFALAVIGLLALYSAWQIHVVPLAPHAPERAGWLFQRFGQQGVAAGTLLMAIVFMLIGVLGMLRLPRRLRTVRQARTGAAAPRAISLPSIETSGSRGSIWSAFIGLILIATGTGIAYVGLYLPFLAGRPHNIKASLVVPVAIGYGLALLLLGQDFGSTMYRRRDGIHIPTVVGVATLVVLLSVGLGLEWWLNEQLHARR